MNIPKIPGPILPNMPKINPKAFDFPIIEHPTIGLAKENYASAFHQRIVDYIITFEKQLDEDHEVGAKLVNFGEAMTIHVDYIGFNNPSLICFYGLTSEGQNVQLIQHVTQISFLLIALPRIDKTKPRIGFQLASEMEKRREESE